MSQVTIDVKPEEYIFVISKEVLLHPELNATCKLVYGAIRLQGFCSVKDLMDFCKIHLNMGTDAVTRSYHLLLKLKLINSKKAGIGKPTKIWIGDENDQK